MDLSTRQMRAFLALRDLRNFTRAAAAVNLSQPAFSTMMRGIEEAVGDQLVIRNSRGIQLTPAGERFAGMAAKLVAAFDDGMRSVRAGLDPGNQVALAAMVALTYDWLPPILAEFRLAAPDADVELLPAFPRDCVTLVAAGRASLAVTALDGVPPGIATEFLWRDAFHVVCAADHPLAGQEEVELHALFEHPFVHYAERTLARGQIDRAMQPGRLRIACETEHIHTIRALVETGVGISLATEMNRAIFETGTLAMRRIVGEPLARDIGLAWNIAKPPGAMSRRLADMLRAAAPAPRAAREGLQFDARIAPIQSLR